MNVKDLEISLIGGVIGAFEVTSPTSLERQGVGDPLKPLTFQASNGELGRSPYTCSSPNS